MELKFSLTQELFNESWLADLSFERLFLIVFTIADHFYSFVKIAHLLGTQVLNLDEFKRVQQFLENLSILVR